MLDETHCFIVLDMQLGLVEVRVLGVMKEPPASTCHGSCFSGSSEALVIAEIALMLFALVFLTFCLWQKGPISDDVQKNGMWVLPRCRRYLI